MLVIPLRVLKWYYDENRIFPITAILKHKQVACVRRKMLFTLLKYLFVSEIFMFHVISFASDISFAYFLELIQIFANARWLFYSVIKFFVIHLKKSREKCDHSTTSRKVDLVSLGMLSLKRSHSRSFNLQYLLKTSYLN